MQVQSTTVSENVVALPATVLEALFSERETLRDMLNAPENEWTDEMAEPHFQRVYAIEEAILTAPTTSHEVARVQLRLLADTVDAGPLTSRSDQLAMLSVLGFMVRDAGLCQ